MQNSLPFIITEKKLSTGVLLKVFIVVKQLSDDHMKMKCSAFQTLQTLWYWLKLIGEINSFWKICYINKSLE